MGILFLKCKTICRADLNFTKLKLSFAKTVSSEISKIILAEVMQMAFYKKENKNINIKVTVRFTTEEKELIDEYIGKLRECIH